jgi:uracil-DNA glycosylase family 4
MRAMPDAYTQLLDATIRHLEDLQARGVRFVPASREMLAELAKARPARPVSALPAARPVAPQAPAIAGPPPAAAKPAPARPSPVPKPAGPVATEMAFSLGLPGEAAEAPAKPALSAEAKAAAFADLRARALACVKCPNLAAARKTVVFGVGSIDAELMFVGEAPGADEDEQGEPFVGRAGELLTRIIQTMGFRRDEVYIGNILKCRPNTPGQSAGNRKPTTDEMKTCIPYLHEQIDLIRPRVLVALGGTAVEGLLGRALPITKFRGQWQTWRGTPMMPTFHPAYLLRNQSLSEKRKLWEDMLAVLEKLGRPITERQRKFFLRA